MIDSVIALAAIMLACGAGIMAGHAVGYHRGTRSRVRRPESPAPGSLESAIVDIHRETHTPEDHAAWLARNSVRRPQ